LAADRAARQDFAQLPKGPSRKRSMFTKKRSANIENEAANIENEAANIENLVLLDARVVRTPHGQRETLRRARRVKRHGPNLAMGSVGPGRGAVSHLRAAQRLKLNCAGG